MNRYPAYKEVDLPWLSEMPQQWCLVRNRDIFTEKTDVVGDDFSNYTLLSLTTKGVIPRDLESGKGKFPSDFKSYKIVHKNDIAFCLFDIDETPRTVGLANEDGMLTGAYTIYQVSGLLPEYVTYYYTALDDIKALTKNMLSTRLGCSASCKTRSRRKWTSWVYSLQIRRSASS